MGDPNTKMATALRLILLLLPLALSYKFDRKEDLIKEKLALQKHISNSIDHGPTYKSRVKGVHHGLLGHRGEHHDVRTKKKQKYGHRGEHQQPANTRYDNDDITLQRLDNPGGRHQEDPQAEEAKGLEEAVQQEGIPEEEDVQEALQGKVQKESEVQETCQEILAKDF